MRHCKIDWKNLLLLSRYKLLGYVGHAHCAGAELHAELRLPGGARVVRKGTNPETDSYSAFFDNTASGDTGLAASLRAAVTEVIQFFLELCLNLDV